MDTLNITSSIISAAATAAGLSEQSKSAISSAYSALKLLIKEKYSGDFEKNIEKLEANPYSERLRKIVECDAIYSGANQDPDIFKATVRYIESLKREVEGFRKKEMIGNLLEKVSFPGRELLLRSENYHKKFCGESSSAYVICVDIRRSTELMLKSRDPELFSEFILSISNELHEIITANFGIVDKFTGDGIIGYFPIFFSGSDAGYMCLTAARECHIMFEKIYKEHRKCFTTIMKNTGLGIGIDYGKIHIQRINRKTIVVGNPIVYAYRLSGAQANQTLINQPAYELLFEKYSAYFHFHETEIEIKNEGCCIAYDVKKNEKSYNYCYPEWVLYPIQINTLS